MQIPVSDEYKVDFVESTIRDLWLTESMD